MFYRIISGDKTLSAFIIIIFALLTWLPAFFEHELILPSLSFQMPLNGLINFDFKNHVPELNLIALFFVLIQGFMLVRINTKFILIQKRTFLPALFYIILSGYLPELHQLNGVLIATLFIILIINILIKSFTSEPNSYSFLNAGLLLGLGSMFYTPLLYFVLFIWISTSILRTFYWREYLFPVLGILTPYLFLTGGLFLFDFNLKVFFEKLYNQLFNGFPSLNITLPNKIFVMYSIILILIASVYMLKVYQYKKIYIRNFFLIMFWLFIISLLVFALASGFNTYLIYIVSIPVTYLLTNYFITSRNTLVNQILLYTLFLGIIFLSMNDWMKWL